MRRLRKTRAMRGDEDTKEEDEDEDDENRGPCLNNVNPGKCGCARPMLICSTISWAGLFPLDGGVSAAVVPPASRSRAGKNIPKHRSGRGPGADVSLVFLE